MKKTLILTVLTIMAAAFITFMSCKKEDVITNTIAGNFKKALNDYESQGSSKNGIELAFPKNPYDAEGKMHNDLLDRFFNEIYGVVDSSLYLDAFLKIANISSEVNADFFLDLINKVGKDFCDKGEYNPTFINNHKYISQTEKSIVNEYFIQMSKLPAIKDRIELSKIAEEFVINENGLSDKEKQRILPTFATYRYSTYYWEPYYEGLPEMTLSGDLEKWDAIADYMIGHTETGVGCGSDRYRYRTGFSIGAYMGFGRPHW